MKHLQKSNITIIIVCSCWSLFCIGTTNAFYSPLQQPPRTTQPRRLNTNPHESSSSSSSLWNVFPSCLLSRRKEYGSSSSTTRLELRPRRRRRTEEESLFDRYVAPSRKLQWWRWWHYDAKARDLLILVHCVLFAIQVFGTASYFPSILDWIHSNSLDLWVSNPLPEVPVYPFLYPFVRKPLFLPRWGSFTLRFIHDPLLHSKHQIYRLLTAGLLHENAIQLAVTIISLRNVPKWMEEDLGKPLYLTAYLASIVASNTAERATYVLGGHGGVAGLIAMQASMLSRVEQIKKISLPPLVAILAYCLYFGRLGVLIGGCIGGMVVAKCMGPRFYTYKRYTRTFGLAHDPISSEYRGIIGYNKEPTKKGAFPVWAFWTCVYLYSVFFTMLQDFIK